MKTRNIIGSFRAVSTETRRRAVPALGGDLSRTLAEGALWLLGSIRPARGFVPSAVTGRVIKLDWEAGGRDLTGLLESSLVKQRLATQPCRPALHPPAGLASQPAGGADFSGRPHDHENTDRR